MVYQDGSRITLQSGGMYGLPLFKGAEYILISTKELPAKTVRVGRAANGTTCWREDNYRPKTANGKRISLLALFPPNVGYSRVPPVHLSDFDGALDSFIREIDGRPAAGPLQMTAISGKWTTGTPVRAVNGMEPHFRGSCSLGSNSHGPTTEHGGARLLHQEDREESRSERTRPPRLFRAERRCGCRPIARALSGRERNPVVPDVLWFAVGCRVNEHGHDHHNVYSRCADTK